MVAQDEGWVILCSITNKTRDMTQNYHITQVKPRNPRNSIIFIPSSGLPPHSLCLLYETHHEHPEVTLHHVTCMKQRLAFQNTPDKLPNVVCSPGAFFGYVQLYHNANASDVDSFSTDSDGTKGQPQREAEG